MNPDPSHRVGNLSANFQITSRCASSQRVYEPLRFTPATRPGDGRVLRVLVFWCDWSALGLAICPDEFGQ